MKASSTPYQIIIVFLITLVNSNTFPHVVWIYWHSGWEDNAVLQSFIMNKQRFVNNDWELRALNSSSLQKWIHLQQGPQTFRTLQGYSDYIRLSLLQKYGGVWIDFTTILLQDFTWLENLKMNPDVQNKKGSEPNVFVFTIQDFGPNIHIKVSPTQTVNLYPGEDNWFIAAKKQSVLIRQWLKEYEKEVQFLKIKKLAERNTKILRQQGIQLGSCGASGSNQESLHQHSACCTALHIVMNRKQKQLDQKYGKNVKFQVYEYGLWSIDSNKNGPMTIYRRYPPWEGHLSTFKYFKALTGTDEAYYHQLKYFIKLQSNFIKTIPMYMGISYFLPLQQFKDFNMLHHIQWNLFKIIDPTQMKIRKNSITSRYLFFNQTFAQQNGIQIFSDDQPEYFYPHTIFVCGIFALILCVLTILQKIKRLIKQASPKYKQMQQQSEQQAKIFMNERFQ